MPAKRGTCIAGLCGELPGALLRWVWPTEPGLGVGSPGLGDGDTPRPATRFVRTAGAAAAGCHGAGRAWEPRPRRAVPNSCSASAAHGCQGLRPQPPRPASSMLARPRWRAARGLVASHAVRRALACQHLRDARGRSSCAPGPQHVGRGGLLRAKACFVSAAAAWPFWLPLTLCSNRWRLCRAVLAAFVTRKRKRHIAEPAARSFCCSGWCRARLFLRSWTPWSAPAGRRRSYSGSWPTLTRGRRLTKSGCSRSPGGGGGRSRERAKAEAAGGAKMLRSALSAGVTSYVTNNCSRQPLERAPLGPHFRVACRDERAIEDSFFLKGLLTEGLPLAAHAAAPIAKKRCAGPGRVLAVVLCLRASHRRTTLRAPLQNRGPYIQLFASSSLVKIPPATTKESCKQSGIVIQKSIVFNNLLPPPFKLLLWAREQYKAQTERQRHIPGTFRASQQSRRWTGLAARSGCRAQPNRC